MNDYYFKAKYIHINQICKQFLKEIIKHGGFYLT